MDKKEIKKVLFVLTASLLLLITIIGANATTYYDDFNSMSITETNVTSYLCSNTFFTGSPLFGTL